MAKKGTEVEVRNKNVEAKIERVEKVPKERKRIDDDTMKISNIKEIVQANLKFLFDG